MTPNQHLESPGHHFKVIHHYIDASKPEPGPSEGVKTPYSEGTFRGIREAISTEGLHSLNPDNDFKDFNKIDRILLKTRWRRRAPQN